MYLAGYTTSTTFPVLNPIQSTNAGGEDAFLTKINPSGSSIIYSTYLGGNADDLCSGLAVDASGNVYMSGYATSSNFPLMNPMQPSPAGGLYDVFVAKVHASGSSLVYSTYLGGSAFDSNTDLAIDNTGNVYVTGWTESPDFPLQNPFQSTHGGASDAFVTKINASGSSLLYSTFLGGSSVELGKGIAVDDVGKIYLVGQVNSSNFPLRYPIQTHQAGSDAFVTVFNPSGSDLVYSTYLGGSDGNDVGQDIAIDNIGNVYVTGEVGGSTNFPTQNAYQGSNGGGTDYFVAKLTPVPDLQIDGQILFHSSRDGNLEIYKMDSDGSSQTRLTNNAVLDFQAAWSPDMSKIAYTSNLAGTTEIYVMDADGSNQVRLTNNTTADSDPTWSPDGAKIAFTSTRDGNSEIYVMNSDGTAPVNVTNTPHEEFKPSWSPSGDKITFTNEGDGNREIYVMNPDGTAKVRLTNNPATDSGATWSADGSKIAFRSDRDGNPEVYIMNADGNNQLRLTSDPADDLNPVWSPDGKRIAFISDRDAGPGKDEIYTMRIDGPNTSRLTDNLVNDVTYSWFTGYYIGKAVKGFSVNRIMTIKNNGSGDLIVSNIAFSDAQFTVSPSNFTVASGSSQQVTVTFTPTVANTTYSTLTITSNDPDSPATSLVINGTGETPVVSVTLPDTTSFYNQSISVPVRLSDTSNLGIVAAEVFVAYDGDLLTAFSAGTTGTLAANGWTVAENIVEGNGTNIDTIKIAMATDNDALVGAGDLININFQVADQRSPASSPLELVHVLFNDGVPDHTKTNGSVTLIGTDATIDSSPATIIPREVITVTVVDVDEDLDNNSADSFTVAVANGAQTETVTVTETGNNTGVFTGSIATVFSLGASSGDGTIQAKAGDQIVFTYTDQLDASGVAAPRTDQTDVVGGNDGAIRTTVVSQPGDTLRVVVTDADLNADTNTQESAQVTAVNPTTGESESIALSEDGVNSDIFFGIVKTAAGSSAGSLGDAALNTAKGDVLTISYLDDVTALGGTSVLQDDDEVVDPFGDADGNGSTQAFDAAQTLLHVLSPHLTGIDSLAANLDLLAYDPVQGRITPFDASLILQKRVGLIGRFPVQEDEADNHPQPQTDNSTPKRITDERRLSVVAGEGYVSVWADERRGIVSGELVLQEVVGVVEMGEELSGFLHAARSREDELHVVFAGAEGVSGAGELLRVYGVVEPDVHLVSASFNDGGIVGRAGESVAEIRPTSFALHPNAPNPFNPETQIGFSLATTGQVELVVYDILGQRVRTLVSTSMSAGVHSARWDGRDASGAQVSSGPYFYRLRAGDFVQTRRMILLK